MRKSYVASLILLLLAVTGAAVWYVTVWRGPRAHGLLPAEVYVWQRAWTPSVRTALTGHATNFNQIVGLRAEIVWQKNRTPQLAKAQVNFATLRSLTVPVGLALRIGSYPGPFTNDAVGNFIADTARWIVDDARTNGLTLSELQIDFDCATAKLDGYRVWLEAIQERVAPTPVTITALPSWLRSRAFQRLAVHATNYVLQVHSVTRPQSISAPFALCDPAIARRAVERAGRIGVPFRVALPTYGYTLAFDATEKFIGLSAEGPRPNWPADARLRDVNSDPLAMAGLVQDWTANRPAALRGLIWFRLPINDDNFNWRWPTFSAILDGRQPVEQFNSRAQRVQTNLVELALTNDGELDVQVPLTITVRWTGARLIAGDAQRGFALAERRPTTATFVSKGQPTRLRAGEQLTLGWLRFDQDCEVHCEVSKR